MTVFSILFLLGLAFYAGYSFKLQRSHFATALYVAFNMSCACLFYFMPIAYATMAMLSTIFMVGLFIMAGRIEKDNNEDTIIWRLNTVITTLFFWPVNMFDLVYFSMAAMKKSIK